MVGARISYRSSIPYDNGLSRLYALDKVENIFQEKLAHFKNSCTFALERLKPTNLFMIMMTL